MRGLDIAINGESELADTFIALTLFGWYNVITGDLGVDVVGATDIPDGDS